MSTDEPLDLGEIEPGGTQDWNETWARARADAERREAAFEVKVGEGRRRYNKDVVFRHKVDVLARAVFGEKRSRRIEDAIRGVVALEEIEGGVLDMRLPAADQ